MMKKVLNLTILITVAIMALFVTVQAAENGYDFSLAVEKVKAMNEQEELNSALLIYHHGEIVFEKYFNDFEGDDLTRVIFNEETRVPIASSTKWVTAALLMTLVDDGYLNLDDPIYPYFPQFNDGDKKSEITLRMLLAHNSGMVTFPAFPLYEGSLTLEEAADILADKELLSDPGQKHWYGGASFQIAGRMAEIVTGSTFQELFEERIKSPLNMESFDYVLWPYGANSADNPLRAMRGEVGDGYVTNPLVAGGGACNARDYMKFLKMFLENGKYNGTRVLSKKSIQEMRRDQVGDMAIAGWAPYGRHYGLGIHTDDLVKGSELKSVSMKTSSPGAYGTVPWIDWDRKYAAIFLTYRKGFITQAPRLYLEGDDNIQSAIEDAIDAHDTM